MTRAADSVYVHDSVWVREAGDTVFLERWHTRYRDRAVHDTVRSHSADTIVMTETVEKLVEAPEKGGDAGWAVALALLAVITIHLLLKTR